MATPLSSNEAGFTPSPNQRGTLDIIWSCLFTVFICTWTVVHPNIPPSRSPWWHKFLDRLIELILAAVAPELILAVAVREWLDARGLVAIFNDGSGNHSSETMQTPDREKRGIVTGFYVVMGGLQVRCGKTTNEFNFDFTLSNYGDTKETQAEGYITVANIKDHLCLNNTNLSTLINESDIRDKGKADSLIKCMLAFQVLWLTAQCIGRAAQHLAITPLEISTLAYVPFMLLSLAFWWRKPYNVETPSSVNRMIFSWCTGRLDKGEITGFEPAEYQPFGLVRECLKVIKAGGLHAPDPLRAGVSSLLFFFFGGLHCIAWSFPFPTQIEQWMWRISSITVSAIIPLVWLVILIYWMIYRHLLEFLGRIHQDDSVKPQTYWHGKSPELECSKRSRVVLRIVATSCVYIYILARMCLMVQIFVGLRSLPEDCYKTVDWLGFVPSMV